MNLFHIAFREFFKNGSFELINQTAVKAVEALGGLQAGIYQDFAVTEELFTQRNLIEMRQADNELDNRLRDWIVSAITDTMATTQFVSPHIDVKVSSGLTPPYPVPRSDDPYGTSAIEIYISSRGQILYRRRLLVGFGRRPVEQSNVANIEGGLSHFPLPEHIGNDAPVILLNPVDLLLCTSDNESIEDLAVYAIKVGWKSVQIHGTQLLLIK